MSYNIFITRPFEREFKRLVKKYKSLPGDLEELLVTLKETPNHGNPLGNACYKIRLKIKSKGKGKSGGARIITCVKISLGNVYLLAIYDKSEKDNLTDTELIELLKITGI